MLKNNFILALLCSVSVVEVAAQVRQRGVATEQNSGGRPLSEVAVMVQGAAPTTSDQNGYFVLNYTSARNGDPMVVVDIHKAGYEIVNTREINTWNISSVKNITLVLCRKGTLDAARRRYYKLGEDIYRKKYLDALAAIEQQKNSNDMNQTEYAAQLNKANEQLLMALSNLEMLSDRFARINKDALNDIDRRALELFEKGDVDGAISIYDESKILDKFNSSREHRDSLAAKINLLRPALEKEAKLLIESDSAQNRQRGDSIRKILNNERHE